MNLCSYALLSLWCGGQFTESYVTHTECPWGHLKRSHSLSTSIMVIYFFQGGLLSFSFLFGTFFALASHLSLLHTLLPIFGNPGLQLGLTVSPTENFSRAWLLPFCLLPGRETATWSLLTQGQYPLRHPGGCLKLWLGPRSTQHCDRLTVDLKNQDN